MWILFKGESAPTAFKPVYEAWAKTVGVDLQCPMLLTRPVEDNPYYYFAKVKDGLVVPLAKNCFNIAPDDTPLEEFL